MMILFFICLYTKLWIYTDDCANFKAKPKVLRIFYSIYYEIAIIWHTSISPTAKIYLLMKTG